MSTFRAPRTVDVAALIDGSKLGRFNYRVIVLSWLVTAFDGGDNLMSGFTAPYLRDTLHLSLPQLGWLAFAASCGMVLGGFVFSYIADRIGRRPAIILCATAFGILTAAQGIVTEVEDKDDVARMLLAPEARKLLGLGGLAAAADAGW